MSKNSVIKSVVALCFTLLPAAAFAGGDAGNGGGAIVCKDSQGAIQKAFMLDLWEAGNLPLKENGYRPLHVVTDEANSYEGQVANALHRIALVNGPAYKNIKAAVELVQSTMSVHPFKMRRIDDSNDFAVPDSNDPTTQGLDCERLQVANYTNEYGIIFNQAIWEKFDETNRAALILHEAIYKVERDAPMLATNSDHARKVVGYLFSDTPMSLRVLGDLATICKEVKVQVTEGAGARFTIKNATVGPASQAISPWDNTGFAGTRVCAHPDERIDYRFTAEIGYLKSGSVLGFGPAQFKAIDVGASNPLQAVHGSDRQWASDWTYDRSECDNGYCMTRHGVFSFSIGE